MRLPQHVYVTGSHRSNPAGFFATFELCWSGELQDRGPGKLEVDSQVLFDLLERSYFFLKKTIDSPSHGGFSVGKIP
jgi:hypothetical protein